MPVGNQFALFILIALLAALLVGCASQSLDAPLQQQSGR
jgi:hypothetical protein